MADLAERTAERAGDMQAVWVARYRRGACPTCGDRPLWAVGEVNCVCCSPCWHAKIDEHPDPDVMARVVSDECPPCTLLREEVA